MKRILCILFLVPMLCMAQVDVVVDGADVVAAAVSQTQVDANATTNAQQDISITNNTALIITGTNATTAEAIASNDVQQISITNLDALVTALFTSNNVVASLVVDLFASNNVLAAFADDLSVSNLAQQAEINALDAQMVSNGYDMVYFAYMDGTNQPILDATITTISNNVILLNVDGGGNSISNSYICVSPSNDYAMYSKAALITALDANSNLQLQHLTNEAIVGAAQVLIPADPANFTVQLTSYFNAPTGTLANAIMFFDQTSNNAETISGARHNTYTIIWKRER